MYNLIKTLNKFNGNVCFAGEAESGYIIIECDRQSRTVNYASSAQNISDISWARNLSVLDPNPNGYFVSFSNTHIGLYSGGILDPLYKTCVTVSHIDQVIGLPAYDYYYVYLLNRTANTLTKWDLDTSDVLWTLTLPDYSLRYDGKMLLRESDGTIIYHNNSNIHVIRDDTTTATILNSLAISGDGDLSVVMGGEHNASYCFARATQVIDIGTSSSSSNSSSSQSSSSS